MKKRLLTILLISALSFALCACGDPATEPTAQTEESTEQQTAQPTETDEPQETEEPQATEEVATEEIETAETTPEPTEEPEPEPQYTYSDMSATMYAKQSVNVRTLPSTDGEKVGALSTNQEVAVSGQCNETGWYRIEYDGGTAYVSNNYLSDTKVEVSTQSASSGGSSSGYNLDNYPVNEWIDMGDWFFYITDFNSEPSYEDIVAILQQRYPDKAVRYGAGVTIVRRNQSVWYPYVEYPNSGTGVTDAWGSHYVGAPQAMIDFYYYVYSLTKK